MLKSVQEHKGLISDLQTSKDQTMVITASKDTSAKVGHLQAAYQQLLLLSLGIYIVV